MPGDGLSRSPIAVTRSACPTRIRAEPAGPARPAPLFGWPFTGRAISGYSVFGVRACCGSAADTSITIFSGEALISWNQRGPAGPTGATGATGLTGAQCHGPQGSEGRHRRGRSHRTAGLPRATPARQVRRATPARPPEPSPAHGATVRRATRGADRRAQGLTGATGPTGAEGHTGATGRDRRHGTQGDGRHRSDRRHGAGDRRGPPACPPADRRSRSRHSTRRGTSRPRLDGNVGDNTSITIGADGLGLISYCDGTNGDLKVAHCANTACTSATTATLDSTADVGHFDRDRRGRPRPHQLLRQGLRQPQGRHCAGHERRPQGGALREHRLHDRDDRDARRDGRRRSVHLDHDRRGRPRPDQLLRLRQRRPQGGPLREHRLHDRDDRDARQRRATSATYTSITIGADGLGLISYYDGTNGDLKVAHCANTACTSATTATARSGRVRRPDAPRSRSAPTASA